MLVVCWSCDCWLVVTVAVVVAVDGIVAVVVVVAVVAGTSWDSRIN